MIIKAPISFDDGSIFIPDGKHHKFTKSNSHDANGRRVTNLVGHNG